MILSDRAVLPLTGSTFEPGNAEKVIKEMEDKESAQIALAEYYYFSANAELCAETVKPYLSHEDIILRLSADMLYTFANLTIGEFQSGTTGQRGYTAMHGSGGTGKCNDGAKGVLSVCLLCN